MIWGSRTKRTIELFEKRFETDGDAFHFRGRPTSAPVRVTAAEKSEFAADFLSFYRFATWGGTGALLLTIVGLAVVYDRLGRPVPQALITLVAFVWVSAFMASWMWAWRAPNRALASRAPAAAGRSRDEARAAAWRNITWANLALPAGFGLLIGFTAFSEKDQLWAVIKGCSSIVLIAAAIIQSFRKWQIERRPPTAP